MSEEGETYRSEALVWLTPEGLRFGSGVQRAGTLLAAAGDALQRELEAARTRGERRPKRVRVGTASLAQALQRRHPDLEIVCAPLPEFDEILASMATLMREQVELERAPSYLPQGIPADAMASLFDACAALYRVKPWDLIPREEVVLAVSSEELGLDGAALVPIGQMGGDRGLALYPDLSSFFRFVDASRRRASGDQVPVPPHRVLVFSKKQELPPELIQEVSAQGWALASAHAYPEVLNIDADMGPLPPNARDLVLGEALARMVTQLMAEKRTVREAWRGSAFHRSFTVMTHGGEVTLSVSIPYQRFGNGQVASESMASFARLSRTGRINLKVFGVLRAALLSDFAASAESLGPDHLHASTVMDLAARYLRKTIATLDVMALRSVLFGLYPRRVSVEPSEAGNIIRELRAFYTYLQHAHGLPHAASCLQLLTDDTARGLETELADPSNFGLAKSLVMQGVGAGGGFEPPTSDRPPAPSRSASEQRAARTGNAKQKATRVGRRKSR